MRIIGLGVDLAEIERVRRLLDKYPEKFRMRCFTAHEQAYAARFADPSARLAARFAGKEAVMKSLGTGWRRIHWTDVEITGGGAPRVNLTGTARRRADALGVTDVLVTITHTDDRALVMAVAVTEDGAAAPIPGVPFRNLLDRVAEGWHRGNPDVSLSAFHSDAVYVEPHGGQSLVGHAELREYFAQVPAGTPIAWHHISFDPATASGAAHFTMGDGDSPYKGVAMITVTGSKIARWEDHPLPARS